MKIQETIPNDFSTRNLVRTRSIQPEEKRTRELSTSEKLMEELRNNYKNIQFDFVDFKNDSQLKEYAMSKPGMNQPVITGGDTCYFLEKHTEALHIRIA